jgi:hypothetical protein
MERMATRAKPAKVAKAGPRVGSLPVSTRISCDASGLAGRAKVAQLLLK